MSSLSNDEIKKANLLVQDASRIVAHDRNENYGHPKDNHRCTAALWSAYLRAVPQPLLEGHPDIRPSDVCMLNILQKISRHAHAPKRDNLVDIIGWALNEYIVGDYDE